MQPLRPELRQQADRVREQIAALGRAVVAFSAGVDSTLLLRLAVDALGDRCLAVTAVSPSLAPEEQRSAAELAARLGARHRFVETHELARPDYVANPPDRCYHCKTELFEVLERIGAEAGESRLLFGANADDLVDDHRPGHRAAREHGVLAPLAEAGLGKPAIRELSRALGLPTWDKPQLACLASRFPYGTAISAERLGQIARAEAGLRALGFRELRVRYHEELARLELGADEFARLADDALRAQVAGVLREAGFRYATIDLEGFRSGRLNDALAPGQREGAV